MNTKNYTVPLLFIGVMFFTVGFALGINSYLVPLVQSALNTSSGVSYMIVAATFSAFFIFSYPSSRIIARIGYRKTMSLSFFVFALAFALFIPSAHMASLPLFLLASFMSGVGNTMLQAAINPYVTILGPLESAAKRISIMGICNALAWPAAPLFLSAVIGKEISAAVLTDVDVPFYIIIAVFLALGVIMNFAPLQEVKAEGEDEDAPDSAYASGKTSIWQFPHLVLGALSLFVYVGVETLALTTTVDYATSLGLDNAESYAIWPSIGMALGYVIGILTIPKYMSQVTALRICTWIAVVGSLAVVLTPPAVSIWCVSFLSLACSLMYPSIWPLAIADLGKFTKTGSALLVMSIGGGALIPLVFGFLKDMTGNQNAYWICLPFYLIIMYYSYYGYRIRK